MSDERYPAEVLADEYLDDGTMPENVEGLRQAVVGRRIVKAERVDGGEISGFSSNRTWRARDEKHLVITLDDGTRAILGDTDDCCAYTELESFWLDPSSVDHVITGVGTTDAFETWHIYADFGDVMRLRVGWSCGNPFYYGYGFDITVLQADEPLDR